jgi:ABC-2 type transport system permease protein
MKNVISIMRRDLAAYFTSAVGYVFIMVFMTFSVFALFNIVYFFANARADMRPYFDILAPLLCVFVPAVTMRVWAEERKENTWEMLLTFPMQAWQLVLGKYLATLVFFAIALFATVTVPVMIASLGDPDMGVIFGGYLGTLFLGAFLLALGIFFSGFFKDQIVAFVITLVTCLLLYLLGFPFIAATLDDKVAGAGTMLSNLLGFVNHYGAFTRGVVDMVDVLYFLAWTIIFLALNMYFIDGRNRPKSRMLFSAALAACIVIGFAFNWLIADQSFGRFDLTENKIYTVSKASEAILADAENNVEIKVYISPREEMPTGMKELEQDITDKLEELRLASEGKLNFSKVYLNVENLIAEDAMQQPEETPEDEAEIIEKRMLDKGVQPFNVRAVSNDEMTNKLIYSSVGIGYGNKPEEIIPVVMPQNLLELEYRIVSSVYKLTRDDKPVVALVAPKEAFKIEPQMKQMLMQMGQEIPETQDPFSMLEQILVEENYEVKRVELTKDSPLPEEYDTLAVINPRDLSERQQWELNRAIHGGKSVVLAVQQYGWDYRATPRGNTVSRRDENPNINPVLEDYGISVSKDILMDVNSTTLTVQGGGGLQALLGGQPFDLPMHVLVNNSSMDQERAITNRISSVFYLWGTPLELTEDKLKANGLEARVVMRSSENAWTVDPGAKMTSATFEQPMESEQDQYPLMAVIEGQFPDAFEGEERPAWPKPQPRPGQPPMPDDDEEAPAAPVEAAPGKMVLIGCAEMFKDNFVQQPGNLDLFLNSIDAVTLTENLMHVRGRKPLDRRIDAPASGEKTMWQLINYGLPNIIIAGIGILVYALRRRARNAYTMAQMNQTL